MDRSTTPAADGSAAMRTVGSTAFELLLPAAARERGEPASAPAARRAVPGSPVLRQPAHGGHAGGQSQAHPAADADSVYRSPVSETEPEPSGGGPRDLPVPATWRFHREAQPSLEHRYYVPSDAWRLSLPGGRDGLVQSLRAQLGTLQYHGDRLLSGCAGGGVPLRPTRDLEFRSGLAVHRGRFPGTAESSAACRSAWMGAAGPSTMCSSSACGAA